MFNTLADVWHDFFSPLSDVTQSICNLELIKTKLESNLSDCNFSFNAKNLCLYSDKENELAENCYSALLNGVRYQIISRH